jgi:nuclear transport factor 2 (NTF2) superfamily protein
MHKMEPKLTLPANRAKWDKLRERLSKKINQFEEHRVAVKTEAYEMHYEDSGAPNGSHYCHCWKVQ